MSLPKTIQAINVNNLTEEIQKRVAGYSSKEILDALFDANLAPCEGLPGLVTSNIIVDSDDWVTAAVLDIMRDSGLDSLFII